MRLLWYAGSSAALAVGVVTYAFNQRANFYSAMVYLSQNNISLMILINLILLVYGTFVYGLQRVCYGQLRPVEVEQLYEKAWFAVTETCLAMTIFREEVGAWFLVMFTALVTGKVWEWIGEGRVEILEQQPPANPRLFHTRLSISLLLSIIYDTWLFSYTINTVIQQARPNMMVMFLFEFAILSTCSFRTGLRFVLSLVEMNIVSKQTRTRLEERRKEVREQRADILRRRESGDAAESEAANQEELPNEEDIDEMDIEVPGWETKGQWVLSLDLFADFVKLGVYVGFFVVLMMFYGLPIHIMRDLFLTTRSFLKRLGALVKYRKALADMNKYPDATQEELQREDTCIICREEMRPWDAANPGAVERSRPKKLPCGHILHLGCLKGWLERQQVCPTCRRSVVVDGAAPNGDGAARPNADGQAPAPGAPGAANGAADGNQGEQGGRQGGMRMFQFGPLRLGFAQGNPQRVQELLNQRFNVGLDGAPAPLVPPQPGVAQQPLPAAPSNNTATDIASQLHELQQRLQQEVQALQLTQAELQTTYALMAELQRLRLYQQHQQVVNSALGLPVQGAPAVNGQGLQTQPVVGHQANHFAAMPPTMASFPPIPQRVQTPTLSRHVASANTAAIPAGSPDLPEGVVIPPGWTLMPLQRTDGQPHSFAHPSTSHTEAAPQPHAQNPFSHETATSSAGPIQSALQANTAHENESTTTGASEAQTEPPQVAAPTPRLPNWGGAAQLFSNGGVGTTSNHAAESSTEGAENHQSHEGHENSDTTDKGKAKAVTVEDTEDSE